MVARPPDRMTAAELRAQLDSEKGSHGENVLALQLRREGIPFAQEQTFHRTRKWRLDFVLRWPEDGRPGIAVEVEGGVFIQGRHTQGAAFEKDAEKYAEAACAGFVVLRVTPRQVRNGQALGWAKRLWEKS